VEEIRILLHELRQIISMNTIKLLVLTCVLSLCVDSFAQDDSMILTDGRFVDGVKIRETKDGYAIVYKNGEVKLSKKMVKECFIEGAEGYVPKNEAEKEKVAKGLVPYEGRWIKKRKRASLIAKKRKKQEAKYKELKSHSEWRNRYIDKTKQFQFEYTLDPDIFRDLEDLMENYYKIFMKDWRLTKPSKAGPLTVCFYHDYDTFLQVGGVGRGVLGYYRFVEPRELNFFYDRLDLEYTIEVMYHETNHYLTHLIDLDFSYPHNIGEAMAEYYGASKWDPKKKKMKIGGILAGRLTEVMTDIQSGEFAKLEDYLRNKLGYKDYTWGWTFVHFMMETPKYSKKFKRFFLGLARDGDVERTTGNGRKTVDGDGFIDAFRRKMKVKNLAKLEKEWHNYIQTKMKLDSHRGYEQAARSALGTNRPIRAKRFYKLAIENGSTKPAVYLQYADMLMDKSKVAEALVLVEKAIELDPLNSEGYVRLSRIRRREGNQEEAKRLILLVREMDPDNTSIMFDGAIQDILNK
jgi:tetratricopeptide (TPR) repeat protein